jgi:hypothetical protein
MYILQCVTLLAGATEEFTALPDMTEKLAFFD